MHRDLDEDLGRAKDENAQRPLYSLGRAKDEDAHSMTLGPRTAPRSLHETRTAQSREGAQHRARSREGRHSEDGGGGDRAQH